MADENLSGVPPSVTLSGLNAGAPGGGIGGTAQPGISGAPGQGGGAGFLPGMEGGLDLNQLMQLLQSQGGDTGVGSAGSIGQSLGANSFGSQQGGLGAGSFGQTQPGYVAGMSNPGAQGSVGNNADPFSIIQKFLGTAQKAAGLFGGANTASPTATGGEDLTLNTDLGGTSGTGSNAGVGTPSPSIEQDMQGALGSSFLNDPTLGSLFTSGKLSGLSPAELSQLSSLPEDQLAGLKTALLGGETQSDLGNQLLGGSTSGFNLGTGATSGGDTNWLGAGAGAASGGLGLINLLKSIESGNVGGATGGGLQGIGGLLGVLKSSPELASALGLDSGGLGAASGGLQTAGGLLGLGSGIDALIHGNATQGVGQVANGLLSGVQGAYALGSQIAPAATEAAVSAVANALGVTAATLGSLVNYIPVIGQVIAAVTAYLGNADEMQARDSGAWNNPIKGSLYSNATQSVGNVNDMLAKAQSGDLSNLDTGELGRMLGYGANNLLPYYATAQGGRGVVRASDTVTGRNQGATSNSTPYTGEGASPEQYTANFTQARTGLANIINELMNRGVTYEQLGQLPVTGDWAQQKIDAGNTPYEMFARNYANAAPGQTESMWAEGNRLGNSGIAGGRSGGSGYDPSNSPFGMSESLLNAALGGSMSSPASNSNASGALTGMYGGPLWAAVARMGMPELMPLVNQHFDPWFSARNWTPGYANQVAPVSAEATRDEPLNQVGWGNASQPIAAPAQAAAPNFWDQFARQPQQQQMNPAMLQQLMAQANSPKASTAGASMQNGADGRLTEETLMDLLRRMSPGAAYQGATK